MSQTNTFSSHLKRNNNGQKNNKKIYYAYNYYWRYNCIDTSKIRNYQIFSTIFVCILGTLLHFTYEFFGENIFVASFSAINESVWEHLKLLFFPMLLTTIIGYFYIEKNAPNFLCSKSLGILASMSFIIIFFYTYTGIIGKSIVFIDIASFFIAVILGEYLAYKLITSNFKCNNIIAIIILTVILICFVVFTYFPPNMEILKDPVTNQYGIPSSLAGVQYLNTSFVLRPSLVKSFTIINLFYGTFFESSATYCRKILS